MLVPTPMAARGLGRLGIAINSAGIMRFGPVLQGPAVEWSQMVALAGQEG